MLFHSPILGKIVSMGQFCSIIWFVDLKKNAHQHVVLSLSLSDCFFFFINLACCKTIYLSLTKEVQNHQGTYAGTYHLTGTKNEHSYWVSTTKTSAIWYMPTKKLWQIGDLALLGTVKHAISNKGDTDVSCPNDYKGGWDYYYDGKWRSTNDVEFRCQAQGNFVYVRYQDNINRIVLRS